MILPSDAYPGPNPNSDAQLKPEPHPEPHPNQVLQFATGAARLPSDVEMAQGWTFSIQASTSFPTIEPRTSTTQPRRAIPLERRPTRRSAGGRNHADDAPGCEEVITFTPRMSARDTPKQVRTRASETRTGPT